MFNERNNFGFVSGSNGRQGDDWSSQTVEGVPGAPDEVHLAAEPGVHPRPDGVRHDLTRQVDLYGRVDRRHLRLLRDYLTVVYVINT